MDVRSALNAPSRWLLTATRIPPSVAMSGVLAIVATAVAARLALGQNVSHYPFLPFFAGVLLSSVLFTYGSGYWASGLSALVVSALFVDFNVGLSAIKLLPVVVFFLVGCAITWVIETARTALVRLTESERLKDMALMELAHRTKNDLAIMSSMLSLEASANDDAHVKAALTKAAGRVQAVAATHRRLSLHASDEWVSLDTYLIELCRDLEHLVSGPVPIAFSVDAEPVSVSRKVASWIGLIVNELIANAAKHAFRSVEEGKLEVGVRTFGADRLSVTVRDNGPGPAPGAQPNLGSRIIEVLARQMDGALHHMRDQDGFTAELRLTAALRLPQEH